MLIGFRGGVQGNLGGGDAEDGRGGRTRANRLRWGCFDRKREGFGDETVMLLTWYTHCHSIQFGGKMGSAFSASRISEPVLVRSSIQRSNNQSLRESPLLYA